jgi:hypothetical protein
MEHTARAGLGVIDRIVMVLAWAVSCGVVYGLGFYTGSHTQDHVRGDEERIVRLPVVDAPPPAGQKAKAGDDLTFWTALEPGGQRAKPGEGIPAAHATAAAPVPAVAKPEAPASKRKAVARPAGTGAPGKTGRGTSATKAKTTAAKTGTTPGTRSARTAAPKTGSTPPAKAAPSPRGAQTSPAAPAKRETAMPRPSGQASKEPRATDARAPSRPARDRADVARSVVNPE